MSWILEPTPISTGLSLDAARAALNSADPGVSKLASAACLAIL